MGATFISANVPYVNKHLNPAFLYHELNFAKTYDLMNWRLGIDLGTNSLGWWAFEIKKKGRRWQVRKSLGGGVYIFPSGREPAKKGRVGDSNAVKRRLARGARRNRDRRKARMRAFMRELVRLELMPEDADRRKKLFQTPRGNADPYNPYFLRSEALRRPLEPYELGRALFHLGLRRGFQSNRVGSDDDDGGDLKEPIANLEGKLDGRTLGQFLWERIKQEQERQDSGDDPAGTRFRGEDPLYPARLMYANEFDAIQKKQAPHHKLDPEDWKRLRDRYVLFQWPLKPVERGPCQFFPEEPRHWEDTPIGHDFRIYQELNALKWIDREHNEHALDLEQFTAVRELLLTRRSEVKFTSLRKEKKADRSLLFPECVRFNLETSGRKGLKPHGMARIVEKYPVLAPFWEQRSTDQGDGGLLDNIFAVLQEEADQETLESHLTDDFGLEQGTIEAFASLRISRATSKVSRKFMEAIVPVLRDQHLLYWEAVGQLKDDEGKPLHHSHRPISSDYEQLPYYGEILHGSTLGKDPEANPCTQPELHFGKIGNPSVHVALNSLRKVVNALISRFGSAPAEIHVELSRDLKNSRKDRDEISAIQAKNKKNNDRIREELKELGVAPSSLYIKKYKLWEELGKDKLARRCPFTGNNISAAQLINGEVEIEHLLPFKRTLDDSMANLTVAMRWANRLKGNKTPHEAFAFDAHSADGIHWETVLERSKNLPDNKKWRFGPNAMKIFERENDFLARQLTDNAYIARSASRYLSCLRGVEQIVPNRGRLTAILRGKWQLNRILADENLKSRDDHRHHAIDAAVVGLTDRSVLKSVSDQSGRSADDRMHILVPELDDLIETSIHHQVHEIVVAFKQDHGFQGQMFEETAYGYIEQNQRDPNFPAHNMVARKSLVELTERECDYIRDPVIREAVLSYLGDDRKDEKVRKKALTRFSKDHGIRSIRILVKDQTATQIQSAPYKRYAVNAYVCCDIWRIPKGKVGKWIPDKFTWKGVYWSYMEVAQDIPGPSQCKPHPAAKFVCRLFKNDMIAYEENTETQIMRVAGFSTTNNKLDVAPHSVADPKREYVSINQLGIKGIRKLHVTPDGMIRG